MPRRLVLLALCASVLLLVLAGPPARAATHAAKPSRDAQPALPITAAFYDTRDPAAQPTRQHPWVRAYRPGAAATFRRQLGDLRYAGIEAAFIPWDAAAPETDAPLDTALRVTKARGSRIRWAARLSAEALGDPTAAEIRAALRELRRRFAGRRAYLRVAGRPVVVVSTASTDTCAAVARWRRGNAIHAYLLMAAFPGAARCRTRPDGLYAERPDRRAVRQGRSSYAISPGFFRASDTRPAVVRDVPAWASRVRAMDGAKADWRLVNSFNDWTDGSAVEEASEWLSPSRHGTYLDVLHQHGARPRERRVQTVGAVGDIACDQSNQYFNHGDGVGLKCRQKAVLKVLRSWPLDAFLMLGDGQYETGQYGAWAASYDKTFGVLRPITYPAIGNHDYLAAPHDGAGYFDYWNGQGNMTGPAGRRDQAYYSYDLGAWHVIVLNTDCAHAGGCHTGSPQERWLRRDLQRHPHVCTLAYWHESHFSSGGEGSDPLSYGFWRDLRTYGADVVLNGHNHDYERFSPQLEDGTSDPSGGIRGFVVGTGGKNLIPFPGPPLAHEVTRNATTYGALRLNLKERAYSWSFQGIAGTSYRDGGRADCH